MAKLTSSCTALEVHSSIHRCFRLFRLVDGRGGGPCLISSTDVSISISTQPSRLYLFDILSLEEDFLFVGVGCTVGASAFALYNFGILQPNPGICNIRSRYLQDPDRRFRTDSHSPKLRFHTSAEFRRFLSTWIDLLRPTRRIRFLIIAFV